MHIPKIPGTGQDMGLLAGCCSLELVMTTVEHQNAEKRVYFRNPLQLLYLNAFCSNHFYNMLILLCSSYRKLGQNSATVDYRNDGRAPWNKSFKFQ